MCRWVAGGLRGVARATLNVCRRIRHGRVTKTRVEGPTGAHHIEADRQVNYEPKCPLNLIVSDARRFFFLNVVFASKVREVEVYESRLCIILQKMSF